MNGFVGYMGQNALQVKERISEVSFQQPHIWGGLFSSEGYIAKTWIETRNHKHANHTLSDHGIEIVIDGHVRLKNSECADFDIARQVLTLYRKYGLKLVHHIAGEFVILIKEGADCHVINDRFGVRLGYWAVSGSEFVCASGPRMMLSTGVVSAQLNETMALNYLMINKFRPDNYTIFKDIYALQPGSILSWKNGTATVEKYWVWQFDEALSGRADIECLEATYRQAMRRTIAFSGRDIAISLSGGLDSRSIVAVLPPESLPNVQAMCWGRPQCQEVELARRVAEVAGIDFHDIPVLPLDFVDNVSAGYAINDELDLFVQSVTSRAGKYMVGRYDTAVVGIVLDAFFGGSHMSPQALSLGCDEDIIDYVFAAHGLAADATVGSVQTDALMNREYDAVRGMYQNALNTGGQDTAPSRYDKLFMEHGANRLILQRYKYYRSYVETATPIYDYDFAEAVCAVPLGQRVGHNAFREWLLQLSYPLSKLPYQRTLISPRIPVQYWKEANKLQHAHRTFCDQVYNGTGGEHEVRDHRHYSDWLQWSKCDPMFRAYMGQLAVADEAPVFDMGLVDREKIRHLWNAHQQGEANFSQLLLHVNSLNGFLATYFS